MPTRPARLVLLLCVWIVVAVPLAARAQAASSPPPVGPVFAVLSLVGDEFWVVSRRGETGSNVDANQRKNVRVDDALLDDVAAGAAERAIRQARSGAEVLRFSIRDKRMFELQRDLLVDDGNSHEVREQLLALLRQHRVERLVMVSKWRDDARFRLVDSTTGSGKIVGVGFYVDQETRLQQLSSGERSTGFLGPFAYVRVDLVDAATLTSVRGKDVREAEMKLATPTSGAFKAWDTLGSAQKVDAMERVLRRAVGKATAAVLAD